MNENAQEPINQNGTTFSEMLFSSAIKQDKQKVEYFYGESYSLMVVFAVSYLIAGMYVGKRCLPRIQQR